MKSLALAVCHLVLSSAGAGTSDGGRATSSAKVLPLSDMLARLDSLHLRRDEAAALTEAHRLAADALAAAPSDYGVLWRVARARFTESDQPARSPDERSRLGKEAYDLATRAIAANPGDVAGHYWAALGIGSYAEGMGIMRALANGIEGKFKRPLERATTLDAGYDHGNIPVIWAAYYLELPWPKRDRTKAAEQLRRALAINPANLRARLYQARIATDEGRPAERQALLAAIAAAPVGQYDAPEERRVKQEAAAMTMTGK
jgi:hypothetical protein